MRVREWMCGVVLVLAVAAGDASGQQADVAAPATSVTDALRSMASRAGVVFVGSVTRVVPEGGVVEIDFKVQQPLLGVSAGTYVAREWAGRWTGAQQRYRVGQSAMFFLHAAGVSGLSSTVDGMMGVVPLVQTGGKAGAMVDLRWVATRVQRAVGAPLVGAATGAMTLADASRVVVHWQVKTTEPVMYPMPGGAKPSPRPVAVTEGQGQGGVRGGMGHVPVEEQINDER
ncbi:MAG: hypothetical protein HIU91_10240 [Acidobacteria bacterium]|nr:hypothetical protein [Acidobacteriota bacterium]